MEENVIVCGDLKVTKTEFPGLCILEPKFYGDNRGWFTETYSAQKLAMAGINTVFVQDNQSFSAQKGTLRGLHFQTNPKCQTKLIRCTRGKIIDLVVDLRKGSPTYLKHYAVELTEENHKQFFIPKGFAHGFVTLTDNVEVQYKVDEFYSKENDRSVRYDDPAFGIDWSSLVQDPILSQKDLSAPLYADSDANFTFEG